MAARGLVGFRGRPFLVFSCFGYGRAGACWFPGQTFSCFFLLWVWPCGRLLVSGADLFLFFLALGMAARALVGFRDRPFLDFSCFGYVRAGACWLPGQTFSRFFLLWVCPCERLLASRADLFLFFLALGMSVWALVGFRGRPFLVFSCFGYVCAGACWLPGQTFLPFSAAGYVRAGTYLAGSLPFSRATTRIRSEVLVGGAFV